MSPKVPVILISVDTLRSDRLPVYGYSRGKTPAIDGFRRDSVLFEHAFSPCPLTLPAHATMMTGLWPTGHGVRNNSGFVLSDDHRTLSEALGAAGYRTGAVVSSMVLRRSVGLDQGFDFYDDDMVQDKRASIHDLAQRTGDRSVAIAKNWLDARDQRPFFLFLHLYDPHIPYEAPEPFASAHPSAYDAEIAFTDAQLADFFDYLKRADLYDESLIVLTSDHGEGLGDHHEKEHGMFLYRELIQVPLLIKLPGNSLANQSIRENTSLVDLFPTITGLLGLETAKSEGVSLLAKGSLSDSRPLYAESLLPEIHFGWFPQKSFVAGSYHYISGHAQELFDFREDPLEQHNLFGTRKVPENGLKLLRRLGEGRADTAQITEEEKALLASLGYVGSTNPLPDAKGLTPKSIIELKEKVTRGQYLVNRGELQAAERHLIELLQAYPAVRDARISLATALRLQGKISQMEHVLMEGLAAHPGDSYMLTFLAHAKYELGKPAEANTAARNALIRDPLFAGKNLLVPAFQAGDLQLAETMARRVLDLDETVPEAHFVTGRLAGMRQDHAAAAGALERASALFEKEGDTGFRISCLVFIAESQSRLGEREKSVSSLREALALNPDLGKTRVLLAQALLGEGRSGEAESVLLQVPYRGEDDGELLQAQVTVLLMNGRPGEALNRAETGLESHGETAAGPLCDAFLAGGDPDLAKKVADLIAKHAPSSGYSDFIYGRLFQARREFEQALSYYGSCRAKAQGNAPLLNNTLTMMGDCAASLNRASEAMAFFSESVRVLPDAPQSRIALATLLVKLGKPEQALAVMRSWVNAYPDPDYLRLARETLTRLGMAEAARALPSGSVSPKR